MHYQDIEKAHRLEHEFANMFGFYRKQMWFIDRIITHPGDYYRYTTIGRNNMMGGEEFNWRVPSLGKDYVFALRLV